MSSSSSAYTPKGLFLHPTSIAGGERAEELLRDIEGEKESRLSPLEIILLLSPSFAVGLGCTGNAFGYNALVSSSRQAKNQVISKRNLLGFPHLKERGIFQN